MAARAIWKGNLRFGKEAIPIKLYAAVQDRTDPGRPIPGEPSARLAAHADRCRSSSARTTLLFCPAHERFLSRDEIVRGYEIERDEFVIVTDQELESIAAARR
jgi:DNA end-binding protein Ku